MKANRFINLVVFLLTATVLTTVSCKKEEKPIITDISLNKSTLVLVLGTPETLTVSPASADVVWTSSNTDVVTVSDGVIVTVGLGDAIVNAKSGKNRAFCSVSVISEPIKVTGVAVKTDTLLAIGGRTILKAKISPTNATYNNVKWSSSNPSIVSVDNLTGEITAISKGEAVITVTTDDQGKTATCLVKVWPALLLNRPYNNVSTPTLNPTDATGNVAFSWIPFQGTGNYILKISLTEDFQTPLLNKEVNGSSTEVPSFELNELLKDLGKQVKVYWTVRPKDPIDVIGEVRTLNIIPDRHEYLKLLTESATNMTVTKGAGEYQYSLSTSASGTSSVNTSALTTAIHPDSTMLSIKYKSVSQMPAMEIFFVKAGGTEAGSITTAAIPSSTNWKEFSLSVKQAVTNFSWGAAGDYLRLRFGNNSQAEVNGLHFRGPNYQEIKDSYVPQILTVSSPNQLTLETVSTYQFKVMTTGTDPNVRTSTLAQNLPSGAVMLTFEYKSSKACLNNLQIYFATPTAGLAEARSIKPALNAAADWTVYSVDLTTPITTYPWGVAGSYMRLDFGNFADYDIEFRNVKIVYKN